MDGALKGEQTWVSLELSNGLELRREPTLNSTTADGGDNVILSMPPGSYLVIEDVEVPMNEGHNWYNVRYIHEDIDETGWAIGDYLSIEGPIIPMTGGGPAQVTDIQYMGGRKFDVAYLTSEPMSIPQGFVKFKYGGEDRQTSLDEWNAVVGPHYRIT